MLHHFPIPAALQPTSLSLLWANNIRANDKHMTAEGNIDRRFVGDPGHKGAYSPHLDALRPPAKYFTIHVYAPHTKRPLKSDSCGMSLFLVAARRRIGYPTICCWTRFTSPSTPEVSRTFTTTTAPMAEQFHHTSGGRDPVWVQKDKYEDRPSFGPLKEDTKTDVCIVGAGIAGISAAYELVTRGKDVVLLDARDVISGESGRTSGHLSNALDDHYVNIMKKHGHIGAQAAADSHTWALNHVGKIAERLGISCDYRYVPGYEISQYKRTDKEHEDDMKHLKDEAETAKKLGLETKFDPELTIKGWDGAIDQRGGTVFSNQAAFHPTKYLVGVLKWLREQQHFRAYSHTRAMSVEEQSSVSTSGNTTKVTVKTEGGNTIQCAIAIEATNIPLQKLSVVAELDYNRTYVIAVRIPKGSVEDCFIYDTAEAYKYIRLTPCDDKDDYLIVGGCDHQVGRETTQGRFEELEGWVRERFSQAGAVDYKWSGQINEPIDFMAFIGKNQGCENIYIATGDSGNGLTHGVIAGRLIADEIEGKANPWVKLYSPKRLGSIAKSLPSLLGNAAEINSQYKRLAQSDIKDIEDLVPGSGGVLNPALSKPTAVYKDENGKVTQMSALCPHMKGVVCWNQAEKSFDCPVHGSRFSEYGLCLNGPAKGNLPPVK